MIIASSQVSYATTHQSESATAVLDETFVRHRHGHHRGRTAPASESGTGSSDSVQLSPAAATTSSGGADQALNSLTPTQRAAVLVLESLLGHKINLFHQPSTNNASASTPAPAETQAPAQDQAPVQAPAHRHAHAPVQVVQRHTELHVESEQTTFQAQGAVVTADGRQIQFAAQLNMQRQSQSASVTTTKTDMADPLVVTFGGAPAQLTSAKVAFDLNSDGAKENVSFVGAGSGFLALDKNGDGQINNGSELFGPQTGSGFAELAAYDADGNGWIDEADPVFSQLRVWTQDGLSSLADKGIGAILATAAETPFTVKDATGATQAQVRNTGIYLSENGAAGIIQQVDLAVG